MLSDIFEVILKLGLPVAGLAFLLLRWSFDSGEVSREGGRKEYRDQMRAMRRSAKKGGKRRTNYLQKKWLRFGGGFYGVAALWTYMVVEVQEVIAFIGGYEGLDRLLDADFGELLVRFLLNSIGNFVVAVTWMIYWAAGLGAPNLGLWVLAAIAGFALGRALARRDLPGVLSRGSEGSTPDA